MLPFNDFLDFIGLPEIRELEERFATTGPTPQPRSEELSR